MTTNLGNVAPVTRCWTKFGMYCGNSTFV